MIYKMNNSFQKINILHLTDMAGGSSIQSYFWKKFNLGKTWLFVQQKSKHTPVVKYYNEAKILPRFRDIIIEGLQLCKTESVDIIWIHQAELLVPIFKLFSNKKIVLSYQGSDINEKRRSINPIRIISRSFADLIIYNQKDHLSKILTIKKIQKEYVVNAVDTDLFFDKELKKSGNLAFISDNLDRVKTMNLLKKFENLTIIDLSKKIIPYDQVPEVLSQYEMMIDLKITNFGLLVPTLSKLALQSLACGLKVYTFQNKTKQGLPERHKPEIVMEKLHGLFLKLLNN